MQKAVLEVVYCSSWEAKHSPRGLEVRCKQNVPHASDANARDTQLRDVESISAFNIR